MHGENPTHDVKVALLAAKQHGVVAYWQLIALGLGRGAIEHRLRTGRLYRVFRGVYAVGHPALTREGRWMAAVLAGGPAGVLSHWSAAAHWGLLRPGGGPVHVSVRRDRRGPPGIRVHVVKQFHRSDCTSRDGIPITTVPRTLLDLAPIANERTLKRAINQADRAGWLNRRAMSELLERNHKRKGTKQLRSLIAAVDPQTHRTRSDLEVDFLNLLRKHKIAKPVTGAELHGYEVDFYWPEAQFIVELDFYEYHRTPAEFANDRIRDAHLKNLEYDVMRVPDAWLNGDPDGLAAHVCRRLASRIQA